MVTLHVGEFTPWSFGNALEIKQIRNIRENIRSPSTYGQLRPMLNIKEINILQHGDSPLLQYSFRGSLFREKRVIKLEQINIY